MGGREPEKGENINLWTHSSGGVGLAVSYTSLALRSQGKSGEKFASHVCKGRNYRKGKVGHIGMSFEEPLTFID